MAKTQKSAQQLKGLLTFVILILALMQSSVLVGRGQLWGTLLLIPYFMALTYGDYHLAFTTYHSNEVMGDVLFSALLTTIAFVLNPQVTLGSLALRVTMISIARVAAKYGKINY